MMHMTSSILLLLSLLTIIHHLANGWKTDKLGDCSQEESNQIDLNLGKIFLFGELKIPFVDDMKSANKWCR